MLAVFGAHVRAIPHFRQIHYGTTDSQDILLSEASSHTSHPIMSPRVLVKPTSEGYYHAQSAHGA